MTVVQIPPADLTVYLRLRWKSEPMPCHFSFDDKFQCQLDTSLLNDDRIDRSFKDSIGSKYFPLPSANKCIKYLTGYGHKFWSMTRSMLTMSPIGETSSNTVQPTMWTIVSCLIPLAERYLY